MLNQVVLVLKRVPQVASSWQRRVTVPSLIPRSIPRQVDILASISIEALYQGGIRGIILDLDNTIISEDDYYLSPGAEAWIETAKKTGLQFFILSNGKRRHRVQYWAERLGIPTISPAKKPFPQAFCRAIAHMELQLSQVIVIGDSFHTDILGAWLVGCPSIQVASLPHPPRWWERILGRVVQIPYPPTCELWRFLK